ncbi:hypothetical protein ZHAS_00006430 [Anopheles sinensis]|uniref:Uncharacterized protein n=1 Tax=Anopheles sinensis TaxID=74873 RepID=A0A084VMA9_ANOSI|nr:hypothetical protein ZHAS_00006430 [Anopheles sinensis]
MLFQFRGGGMEKRPEAKRKDQEHSLSAGQLAERKQWTNGLDFPNRLQIWPMEKALCTRENIDHEGNYYSPHSIHPSDETAFSRG